jgi:hypothetical protein
MLSNGVDEVPDIGIRSDGPGGFLPGWEVSHAFDLNPARGMARRVVWELFECSSYVEHVWLSIQVVLAWQVALLVSVRYTDILATV